jgi:hypothetical protein
VRQIIPAFALASLVATSERQRAPLSVLEESQGLKAFTICGSQSLRAAATA